MIRPSRSRSQGFTIVELMLVMVIIGVLTTLIAPSTGVMLADARAAGAAEDIVRLHRHVRARVLQTGLAHLVMWSGAGDNGHGTLTVLEGMNNRCSTTPWQSAIDNAHAPIETLRMAEYNPAPGNNPSANDTFRQVIQLTAKEVTGTSFTANTGLNVCFQPNGHTYVDAVAAGFAFTMQPANLVFVVTRRLNTGAGFVTQGLPREVVFPVSGHARHLQ
jgi:prepilin-type N-terminal cleavage/methylation domain-containing protein